MASVDEQRAEEEEEEDEWSAIIQKEEGRSDAITSSLRSRVDRAMVEVVGNERGAGNGKMKERRLKRGRCYSCVWWLGEWRYGREGARTVKRGIKERVRRRESRDRKGQR